MVLGSWVGDPLPVSLFSFIFFLYVLHLLLAHQLLGFGCDILPSVPQYFFFFHLFSALLLADPTVVGVDSCIIKFIY